MDSQDVERTLTRDDAYARHLKANAFETRIDSINTDLRNAKSQEDIQRLTTLKEQSINTVRKYRQTYP